MSAAPLSLARALAMGPIGAHRLPGSTIGPYVVEAELGRGAFGVVARARPRAGGPPVAIKALIAGADATVSQRRRFEREALVGEAIAHDNVVRVVDAGEEEGLLWIAMELVEGRTLKKVVDEDRPGVDEVVRLLRGVAAGLAAAHARGVIHRDLKPENILVRASDGRPLLTDFGLARELDLRSSLTRTGALIGTPAYMAPEQIKGKPASMATDVFALGAILYAGLTGRPPFSAHLPVRYAEIVGKPPPAPSSVTPEVGPALDAVVLRALAARPEDRFVDAGAFLEALDAATGEGADAARPASARRGLLAAAVVVGALALALVGVVAARVVLRAHDAPAGRPASPGPAVEAPPRPATPDELWARAKDPTLDAAGRRQALAAVLRARPDHEGALALWDQVRAWEQLTPPSLPPARDGAARLVWDPTRQALLLFGGWLLEQQRIYDDLWAWDGATWTPLEPAGARPAPRHGHALAWDEGRGRLVLHGGLLDGGSRVSPETWEWDGAAWTPVGLIAGPEARCWQTLEWDPERRAVVLFAGRVVGPKDRAFLPQDDTWEWDGDTWKALQLDERPPLRWAAGSVHDGARRRLVVFGGFTDGGAPERARAGLAGGAQGGSADDSSFREAGERSRRTHHTDGPALDDLWAFKDGAWTRLEVRGPRPPGRSSAGFVLDGRGRAVLHGGEVRGSGYLDDTWLLDLQRLRWTRLDPPSKPSGRAWHAMGYDPVRRCVVVFGGQTAGGRVGDLWVLPDLP